MTTTPRISRQGASVKINAEHLRRLRQDRGLTQTQLAELTGLAAGHISQLETGARTHVIAPTYRRLREALGVTASDELRAA